MTSPTATKPRSETRLHGHRGIHVLQEPALNRGTAFTDDERDAFGLRGLLPPHVFTQDEQVERIMWNYRQKTTDLERYVYLTALQDRNEKLFYRVILDHIEQMLPIIYTPTVGEAAMRFARSRHLAVRAGSLRGSRGNPSAPEQAC